MPGDACPRNPNGQHHWVMPNASYESLWCALCNREMTPEELEKWLTEREAEFGD